MLSDPANPMTLSTTHVTEAGFTAVAYDDKGEVFAGSAYGFLAVDRGMAVSVSGVSIKDILIAESLAYVLTTGAPDYLTIIDTDGLTVRSTLQVGSSPGDMELREDGVLFFADNGQGIVAVDVSDPDAPAFLGIPGGSRLGTKVALAE